MEPTFFSGTNMRPNFSVPRKILLCLLTSVYFPPCRLSPLCHVMNNILLTEGMDISNRIVSGSTKEEKRVREV